MWVRAPPGACCVNDRLSRDRRASPCSITLSSLGKGSLGPREPRPRGSRSGRRLRNRHRRTACARATGSRFADNRCGYQSRDDRDSALRRAGYFLDRGNALELPFENGSFDVVLCQQGFQFFPRSRGRGPRNATRSRGGRPDRLKHVATARRKPSFSMAWIARPRVNLVPAPIAVFRSAGVHPRLPADG